MCTLFFLMMLLNEFSSASHSEVMMTLFFSSRRRSAPLHLSTGGDSCCWRFKTTFHTENLQWHHRRRERSRNSDPHGELLCKLVQISRISHISMHTLRHTRTYKNKHRLQMPFILHKSNWGLVKVNARMIKTFTPNTLNVVKSAF